MRRCQNISSPIRIQSREEIIAKWTWKLFTRKKSEIPKLYLGGIKVKNRRIDRILKSIGGIKVGKNQELVNGIILKAVILIFGRIDNWV